MGMIELKRTLKELYEKRDKINDEIQEVLNAINEYEEEYKDDPYFQKHGVAFEEIHDYSP